MLKIGDWVMGVLDEGGAMVQGCVDSNFKDGAVRLYITKSDDLQKVGKTVVGHASKLKKMTLLTDSLESLTKGELLNLIDFALLDRNEADFRLYSSLLQQKKEGQKV